MSARLITVLPGLGLALAALATAALAALAPSPIVAPGPAPEGMVRIPGGAFQMGSDAHFPEEAPAHEVAIAGFWMDRTEVTNAAFARFVTETGYRTVAERGGPEGAPPGAPVFAPGRAARDGTWWDWRDGASWRHPEGPDSHLFGREQHPVVQVAWADADAFCRHRGARLPTEAEWERAARGGREGLSFVWGSVREPDGVPMANTWQGRFPGANLARDGWGGTAEVGRFAPNGYGLYDMAGNVWEWTADWYRHDWYHHRPGADPRGPSAAEALDPSEPAVAKRVLRGGSFLCSDRFCARDRPSARSPTSPDTSLPHVGFRCARDG